MAQKKNEDSSIEEQIMQLMDLEPTAVITKEKLKEMFQTKEEAEDFLEYLKGLNTAHEDFEILMNAIKNMLHDYQQRHPQQLTTMALFHIEGDKVSAHPKPGKGEVMHCLTNVLNDADDEPSKAHIIEILFQNCKMSRAFKDILEGTYLCLKKANMINK